MTVIIKSNNLLTLGTFQVFNICVAAGNFHIKQNVNPIMCVSVCMSVLSPSNAQSAYNQYTQAWFIEEVTPGYTDCNLTLEN